VNKISLIAKRRPYERPPARVARLALEEKLMRRPMRQVLMRLPHEMVDALDVERRQYYDRIPPRNVVVRELLSEALALRRLGRPKKPPKGEPFHIDI
jgi:hypothetical protein